MAHSTPRKLGLSSRIIENAQSILSEESLKVEELLSSAERHNRESEKLQQEIAFEAAEKMVGRDVDAVIEGRITDSDDDDGLSYVARTYKDAPDIDGYLFVTGVQRELMTGDYIKVHITGSNEYDLIGEEII